MYGKQTEYAIAAVSRLAEVYDEPGAKLSAAAIAEDRGLQRPFVGKVMTVLSQAGLVTGSRGPGGGFRLVKPPKAIRIYDVFKLFEREDQTDTCPFGGGRCGVGDPCPLHDKLVGVQKAIDHILHETTFDRFRRAGKNSKGKSPGSNAKQRAKRESYRAAKR